MAWPSEGVSNEQIEQTRVLLGKCVRDHADRVMGVDLRLVYELVTECQRHRAALAADHRARADRDRALVAQLAAAMASDRGCAPLGEHTADQYASAAREILAAVDRSAR